MTMSDTERLHARQIDACRTDVMALHTSIELRVIPAIQGFAERMTNTEAAVTRLGETSSERDLHLLEQIADRDRTLYSQIAALVKPSVRQRGERFVVAALVFLAIAVFSAACLLTAHT